MRSAVSEMVDRAWITDFTVLHLSQVTCKLHRLGESSETIRQRVQATMTQLNLSARAYRRILKLARTIADLAGSEEIQSVHLAEALHAPQPAEVDAQHYVMSYFNNKVGATESVIP
ncbi:MAG: hypothetical protein AB1649_08235 [Chloroflexota bacterium]